MEDVARVSAKDKKYKKQTEVISAWWTISILSSNTSWHKSKLKSKLILDNREFVVKFGW